MPINRLTSTPWCSTFPSSPLLSTAFLRSSKGTYLQYAQALQTQAPLVSGPPHPYEGLLPSHPYEGYLAPPTKVSWPPRRSLGPPTPTKVSYPHPYDGLLASPPLRRSLAPPHRLKCKGNFHFSRHIERLSESTLCERGNIAFKCQSRYKADLPWYDLIEPYHEMKKICKSMVG